MKIYMCQEVGEALDVFERRVAKEVTASFDRSVRLRVRVGDASFVEMSRADFIAKYPRSIYHARTLLRSGDNNLCEGFEGEPFVRIERV